MGFPVIPAAIAVARLVLPEIGDLLAGDRGEKIAETVADKAGELAGVPDHDELRRQLQADPELRAKIAAEMKAHEVELRRIDSEVIRQVNETMRAEYASGDKYKSRWRPTYGYLVAISWFLQMTGVTAAIVWVVVTKPELAATVITALGNATAMLMPLWGLAMAVLGVSVQSRSKDKQVAAGQQPSSVAAALASIFKKGA